EEGPQEKTVEEVVLERRLADLSERGVLAREAEADPAVVSAELERERAFRLRLVDRRVLGERRDARHEYERDVPSVFALHRLGRRPRNPRGGICPVGRLRRLSVRVRGLRV